VVNSHKSAMEDPAQCQDQWRAGKPRYQSYLFYLKAYNLSIGPKFKNLASAAYGSYSRRLSNTLLLALL
jgi:hypothetical protein